MSSSVTRKFQSAWSTFSTEGPLGVGRALAKRIATFETYTAFRFDLTQQDIPPLSAGIPLSIRRATESDFAQFRSSPYPFRRHAELHDRYGIDECYLAFSQEAIAHLAWVYYPLELSRHPTPFRILRPDEAAIANCVTIPDFRGKGIYPAVVRTLLLDLKQRGYRYCYMYIEVDNSASARGVSKVGFTPVGRSRRLRLFFHSDPAAGFYFRGRCR